jgi:hypothetical protein
MIRGDTLVGRYGVVIPLVFLGGFLEGGCFTYTY